MWEIVSSTWLSLARRIWRLLSYSKSRRTRFQCWGRTTIRWRMVAQSVFRSTGRQQYPILRVLHLEDRKATNDTRAQRLDLSENQWTEGGFAPTQGNYSDFMTDLEACRFFCQFWRHKFASNSRTIQNWLKTDPVGAAISFRYKAPFPWTRFIYIYLTRKTLSRSSVPATYQSPERSALQ